MNFVISYIYNYLRILKKKMNFKFLKKEREMWLPKDIWNLIYKKVHQMKMKDVTGQLLLQTNQISKFLNKWQVETILHAKLANDEKYYLILSWCRVKRDLEWRFDYSGDILYFDSILQISNSYFYMKKNSILR